ncbi:SseB family protein [Leucobacter sp. Psy1]|uniref:SseB family protein n=1 Tax=Leucobacter sp. Psy1 TaxID=2875729 RepID=UPI001CD61C95|nr:SseB family protein [Leucobacter sp. Psy1]
MAEASIPEDVSADYENPVARAALDAFRTAPDYPHLAALLTALREGYLVVDVTGTRKGGGGKKGARVRTIRSTQGQLVLPIFTSMAELRAAVTDKQRAELKGAVMPALEALRLISTDRFVAAEIDHASAKLVLLRKYVELAAGGDPITAETLEQMKR